MEKEEGRAAGIGGAEMDKVDRVRPLAGAVSDTSSELRILVEIILVGVLRRGCERADFGRDDVADHQSKSWSQLCLAALIHEAVTP